jgi:MoxR-like ATPase
VPYPSLDAERRMLFATTGATEDEADRVLSAKELLGAQRLTRLIPVGEQVAEAVLRIVRAARPGPEADDFVNKNVAWGPSPRASQALMLGARARALLQGRLSPSIDDVAELVLPVFKHRMAVSYAARAEDHTVESTISRLKSLLA